VLVSLLEDADRGTVQIHVTNDRNIAVNGTAAVRVLSVDGTVLRQESFPVSVRPRSSRRAGTLSAADLLQQHGPGNILVEAVLRTDEGIVSDNLATFSRPKRLSLRPPGISASVREESGVFHVTLRAKRPALWVWLELDGMDARYSDNFFHLLPGRPVEVLVRPATRMRQDRFARRLKIRSLVDTF